MARRLWPTPTVARILRVDPTTLLGWKADGRLVPDRTDVAPFLYETRTLTAFLHRSAQNFGNERLPTFSDLAYGRERLFIANELMLTLGLTQSGVSWQTVHGVLPSFALSKRALRYPSRPIKKMLTAVSKDDAARILGVEPATILDIAAEGKLERLYVPGHSTALFVTRESFHSYLADRLADSGIPVGTWWEDQLTYNDGMMSPNQICDMLHIAWPAADELLTSGRLPFIRTPGGFRLVPERYVHWLAAGRVANKTPISRKLFMTDVRIAAIFAVMPRVAKGWVLEGRFCNGQHGECRAVECVRQFITDHRTSTTFTAEEWMKWASPSNTTTLVDAEGMIDITEPAVADALRDERLRGVWSPDQRLVLYERDLQRFLRWYERQIFGPS